MNTENINPIFEIKPENYYLGKWFAGDNTFDVLAMAWREPSGEWFVRARTRRHLDDKAFDSEDIKNVYNMKMKADMTEEEIRISVSKALESFCIISGMTVEFIEGKCYGDDFAAILMNVPRSWMHMMKLPKE